MLLMRHQSRLLFCRLGLVLFCILPTTAVAAWLLVCSFGYAGASKAEWERELTSRLGLIVLVDHVSYAKPGVARLTGTQLLDPETQVIVAEVERIEIGRTEDDWQ